MKKIISLVLFVVCFNVNAQERDSSKIGRVAKDTMATPTYTYDLSDPLVVHYEYVKPPVKENILSRTQADSTFDLKGAIKFPFTALLANKVVFAYERVFKYKYSWEIQPMYIFANPLYDGITQEIWPNISFENSGAEVRFGLNLLMVQPYRSNKEKIRSKGIFISYRYQHASNVDFSTDGKGGQAYHYNYKVSQTKNLIGVFYRHRTINVEKKMGLESFYEVGFYTGIARTVCFSYAGAYGDDTGTPMEVKSVGMPMENGFVFAPVIRVGMAIRYNSRIKK